MCKGGRRILQFIPSSRPHLFTHSLTPPLSDSPPPSCGCILRSCGTGAARDSLAYNINFTLVNSKDGAGGNLRVFYIIIDHCCGGCCCFFSSCPLTMTLFYLPFLHFSTLPTTRTYIPSAHREQSQR